ncbi:uncharacterized protein LOC126820249 isoform X2 [Patella vulgata]|uniref:uncharacterized protein LOC126820249 isoform X2 n=1 Tax=Patella vulgata TaxID=6465 RepID=UPI0024A994EC|nr:uncharacterized protein LOC126820249 isoform X2 [Patella vulgata]
MPSIGTAFAWTTFQLTNSFRREFVAPHIVKIQLPGGFPYEAFDGQANIKPWSLLSLVESGRAFSFNGNHNDPERGFLDFNILYNDVLAFNATCSLNINRDLYRKKTSKSPLIITKKLVYAGTSTINILTEVSHPEIKAPLAECRVQTVCVDKTTRRPTPTPEWWNEKYKKYSKPEEVLKWRLSYPRPSAVTSYPLIIQPSDCDAYSHTNWTNYLKFCCDALVSTNVKKDGTDLKLPQIKLALLNYVKEGNVGEQLSVDFWSPPEKKCICFEILDENKEIICQAQLEMHEISRL